MIVTGFILSNTLNLLCYRSILRVHDLIVDLVELTYSLTHFLLVAEPCRLVACMKTKISWCLLDVKDFAD